MVLALSSVTMPQLELRTGVRSRYSNNDSDDEKKLNDNLRLGYRF